MLCDWSEHVLCVTIETLFSPPSKKFTTNLRFLFVLQDLYTIVTCCKFPPPPSPLPFSSLFSSSLSLPPFSHSLPSLTPSHPPSLLSLFSQTRYDHHQSHGDSGLKQALAELIPKKQKEVKEFRAQHGGFVVGDVNIDMVSVHLSLSSPVSSFD